MFNSKFYDVLKYEGVVSIITSDLKSPHVVNTWNSYIKVEENKLLIPVGRMNKTEDNLKINNEVLLTLGSREVMGKKSMGCGFLLKGKAIMINDQTTISKLFPWARKTLVVEVYEVTQTL